MEQMWVMNGDWDSSIYGVPFVFPKAIYIYVYIYKKSNLKINEYWHDFSVSKVSFYVTILNLNSSWCFSEEMAMEVQQFPICKKVIVTTSIIYLHSFNDMFPM